jgi:hypothetical protein
MERVDRLMTIFRRELLRVLDCFLRFLSEFFKSECHIVSCC